jgi:hypothetical protein
MRAAMTRRESMWHLRNWQAAFLQQTRSQLRE